MADIEAITSGRMGLVLSGDPEADWLAIRRLIDGAAHDKLKLVAEDAQFIRLLNRGTQLRENLTARWRVDGSYAEAREIVSGAPVHMRVDAEKCSCSSVPDPKLGKKRASMLSQAPSGR